MKQAIVPALLVLCLLAGCRDRALEDELAATRSKLVDAEHQTRLAQDEIAHANTQAADLRRQLARLQQQLDAAAKSAQAGPAAPTPDPRVEQLQATIAALEKRIAELESAKPQPAAETPRPAQPETGPSPAPDARAKAEAVARLDALLPLVKSDAATTRQRDEMLELLFKTDKETRDRVIAEMQKWVTDEPSNKQARLALASALVSRFADLKRDDFMGQATLAGKITEEAEEALKLDPEFYDAVAFLALMKVEYPTFSPEFKGANKDLERALKLQAKMTWEDHFADIYVGYSTWYRKQGKLDEAAARCQAGLDKAPRHEGLLAEKKKVEDARKPAGE
jgi:tetratricopeptide (TPR) repeat protein